MTRPCPMLAALLLAAACSRTADAPTVVLPPLPPLQLRTMIAELQASAHSLPAPTAEEQRELDELAAVALAPADADPRTAARAERSLLDHPQALAVLEPALAHADAAVRARAAWLCGRSGGVLAVFPLLFRLKYENDPRAVLWLGEALHHLGNHAGLPWIEGGMGVEATADEAGRIAIGIAKDCGIELPEAPTWDQLRAAMRDLHGRWLRTGVVGGVAVTPPPAAAVAARVAAHLVVTQGTLLRPVDEARWVLTRGGRLVVPHLQAALLASEPYLRTMVLQVAAELGPAAASMQDAMLPLLGDPLTAPYVLRALGELHATAHAAHIVARLDLPDTELRAAAAGALGVLGHTAAVPRLRQLLAGADETPDVRVMAAFSLAMLGADPQAEAFLQERRQKGDYHAPTLDRLLERIQAQRR